MSWTYLFAATLIDVVATLFMKQSEGFSRLVPAFLAVGLFGLSIFALTRALEKLDIIPVYATWVGLGTALVTVVGVVFLREAITPLKLVSLLMVVVGVIGITAAGETAH